MKKFILLFFVVGFCKVSMGAQAPAALESLLVPITEAVVADERPVALVTHGLNVSTSGAERSLEDCQRRMTPMIEALAKSGKYSQVLFFHYDFFSPFDRVGHEFATAIQKFLPSIRGRSIHIFAHSNGGLVARHALEVSEVLKSAELEAIEYLFTFGAPHLGIPADLQATFEMAKTLGPIAVQFMPHLKPYLSLLALEPSLAALYEGSKALTTLNKPQQSHRPIPTLYVVIQGDSDTICGLPLSAILRGVVKGKFDGIVPVYGAEALKASAKVAQTHLILPFNHNQMVEEKFCKLFCSEILEPESLAERTERAHKEFETSQKASSSAVSEEEALLDAALAEIGIKEVD